MRIPGFLLLLIFLVVACGRERIAVPKPRVYPRVIYPEKDYRMFRSDICPFSFSYPAYTEVEMQSDFFGEKPPHPCWFDIYYPRFDARIYCSYSEIADRAGYDNLVEDTYRIVGQINRRSEFMEENVIRSRSGAGGILFEFQGPAASPSQFFLTDTTNHFLKGAFYFNTETKPDSLRPVTEFIMEDIYRMLETFSWSQNESKPIF